MVLAFTTLQYYEAIYFYYMWHQWKSNHKSNALLKLHNFSSTLSFLSFTVREESV